jgi:hypothetical protein
MPRTQRPNSDELIDALDGARDGRDNFVTVYVSTMPPRVSLRRQPGPREIPSPHEGTCRSDRLPRGCYFRIFSLELAVIVHIDYFVLARTPTEAMTDWGKTRWRGEGYYHAAQKWFLRLPSLFELGSDMRRRP